MASVFWTKCAVDNRTKILETRGVPFVVPTFHELWSTNGLKWDRSFYQPFLNSAFCFVARRHTRKSANGAQPNFAKRKEVHGADASRIRWRCIVNVNATIQIGPLVSWNPKHFKLMSNIGYKYFNNYVLQAQYRLMSFTTHCPITWRWQHTDHTG